jgi:DNA repair protein RecO (recombination protein O)
MADGRGTGLRGARVYRAEAVVLRRLSIGETDRVVTLFTRNRGKVNVIAKGARGPRSRLAGVTEPFTYFNALLAQGQNLDVLTQAEVQDSFIGIRRDLERIGFASYFLEIVDAGVAERQPVPEFWDLLVAALATLDNAATPDVLTRAFELHAMRIIGYEPRLYQCALDETPVGPGAAFHPLRGGMVCPRCARTAPGTVPVSGEALAALRSLTEEPLLQAARSGLPEPVRRELGRCLVPYVRHHLEAPLRSLQFLDDVTAPILPGEG